MKVAGILKCLAVTCVVFVMMGTFAKAEVQKYPLNESKRVEGVISGSEANRIRIEGDRIVEVIGLSEDFALESDERLGQIFVKSGFLKSGIVKSGGESSKNAVFTVVTEKGKTQDFKLKVKSKLDGQIIFIESKDQEFLKDGKVIGSKHARHDEIVTLIKMGRGLERELKQKPYMAGELEIIPHIQRKSGKYTLEVWELVNKSKKSIILTEKQFASGIRNIPVKQEVAAVMIENRGLESGEGTRIFKVIYNA